MCGRAAFASSTNEGRKPRALNNFTAPKVLERDGPSRRLSHSNAEPHLPTPQRLDPQDSRMDLFEQGSSESAKVAGLVSGLPEQRQKRQ
ncbi:MAG: hypothetical protein ACKPHU_05425, partial [Planctomycetaceae bacterium]